MLASAETILESITDGFFALDRDSRVTYVNTSAQRLMRRPASSLLGQRLWDTVPQAVGGGLYEAEERVRAEHVPVHLEAESRLVPGWVSVSAYPTDSGGAAFYFRDISAEKRTRQALQESEERFRVIFEQAPVGIAYLEPDGRWRQVNRSYCHILGYTRDELRNLSFQELTHPEDISTQLRLMSECLRGEADSFEMNKRYIRRYGEIVPCHLTCALVRHADHTPKYFIAIIEDISDRVEANTLLAAAAHELRGPVSHIKGFASSLRSSDVELGEDIREEFLDDIEREADRLAELIEDLLQRTRALHDAITGARRIRIALRDLVAESARRVASELGTRAVRIHVPETLPSVEVDANAIERVLINLLVNANKYSPTGSPIDMSAQRTGGTIELRVEDRGPGVRAEEVERIFEPFYRCAGPGTDGSQGLGLAICRAIVTAHGGRIWVDARPGGGARFTIALPLRSRAHGDESAGGQPK